MIYGRKYTVNYKRRSNNLTTIDILEKNYSGGVTELRGDVNCVEINFTGNVENLYEPTRGTGAQLKLLVEPLTVLDLFTDDPQKFIVKIYHGTSGNNLIFQGFLPCGIYNESYSTNDIVDIQLIANDGMAVLEDISFRVSETGATYTGVKTVGQILTIVLGKLNLTFSQYVTMSDLQLPNNSTNLFSGISCMCGNYYDENEVAMSCREVLNSIFQPLGLIMSFRGDKVYFIDPICLNDPSKCKTYDITGGTETSSTLGGVLNISDGDLTYYETGQQIDIIKPWNSIELTYDPYTWISGGYEFGQLGNYQTGSTTWGWYNYSGDTRPEWKGDYSLTSGLTAKDWLIQDDPATLWGVREMYSGATEPGDPIYYIQRVVQGWSDGKYTYTFPGSDIKQDDQLMLEFTMDVFINTRHYYNIFNPTETTVRLSACKMNNIVVKVGNYYYNDTTGKWQNSEHYCKILVRQLDAEITQTVQTRHKTWFRKAKWYKGYDTSDIADTWTTCKMYIPLSEESCSNIGLLSGPITLKIYRGCSLSDIVAPHVSSWSQVRDLKNIMIKSVGVTVVNTDKMDIQNDGLTTRIDIVGVETRKKSPLNIKLTSGIGVYGSSRGAFSSDTLTPVGTNLTGLKRSGDLDLHTTNQLLGQNLVSQYRNQRIKMSGNYDVTNYYLNIQFYLIQDDNYLPGKNWYIVNGTYNDENENLKCDMIEIVQSREIII